jgi:uncharacterized protein YecE (DUF72 family)
MTTPRIRVGIGGWNFAEWRGGVFYPAGLPAAQELHFASRQLTSIEINATFYATQKAATYARWRDETPEGFQFAVKAHRFATQRKTLSEGAESVVHFLESGIAELGDKLGPIVWQLPPYRRFDADDVEHFFALLPDTLNGLPLRHVLEPRHASFACADYVRLARDYRVATVFTDSPDYPHIADVTADFVYARLMRAQADEPAGYAPGELDAWARRVTTWARGESPADLPLMDGAPPSPAAARDVFVYFIGAAKARNPAAALGLIKRLPPR